MTDTHASWPDAKALEGFHRVVAGEISLSACGGHMISAYSGGRVMLSAATAKLLADALRRPVAETDDRAVELAKMRERKDAAYLERNQVVAALAKCFPSGVARTAIEGWSDDWHGCVYIDLPTGQVSWHFHDSHAYLFAGLPPYRGAWDGHDTPEKYNRLAALTSPSPKPTRETFSKERIEMLIAIWSMRPAPESPTGLAWQDGARQAWKWAAQEVAAQPAQAGETK